MKLSADKQNWQQIAVSTHNRLSEGSPWSVQLHFAALLGNHGVTASWAGYTPNAPSCWTVLAVTDDARLLQLRLEFDAEQYDKYAEQQAKQYRQSVKMVVREASSRRLRDAVSLHIGGVAERRDGFQNVVSDQVSARLVSVRFADGCEVDLGIDQTNLHDHDDLARTDELLDAVRDCTGL